MPYSNLQQLKKDILSFGLKFAMTTSMPTDKQFQRADTAFWWPYAKMPIIVQRDCFEGDGDLLFGFKSVRMKFDEHCKMEKLGLKGFLFRSIRCGICTDWALRGSNGCKRCGFLICALCEMKVALSQIDILNPITQPKTHCGRCRMEGGYDILKGMSGVAANIDKLTGEENQKLNAVALTNLHVIRNYAISGVAFERSKRLEEILKNKLDKSKCASCKTKFVAQRSNCGRCKKVSYCNTNCQRAHWPEHKNDCKLFRTYNDAYAQ